MSNRRNGKFPRQGIEKLKAGQPKAKTLNLYPLEEVILVKF